MVKEWRRYSVVLALMLFLFGLTFVVAAGEAYDLGKTLNEIGQSSLRFTEGAIGLSGQGGPIEVLTYLFMGLILFTLIYSVVDEIGFFGNSNDKKSSAAFFNIILSLSITFLALIALPDGLFSVILPSYGAMGAAILTVVPFLILFWFTIKVKSASFAKMTWFVFSFYHFGYYLTLFLGDYIVKNPNVGTTSGLWYAAMGILGLYMSWSLAWWRKSFWKAESDETKAQLAEAMGLVSESEANEIRKGKKLVATFKDN